MVKARYWGRRREACRAPGMQTYLDRIEDSAGQVQVAGTPHSSRRPACLSLAAHRTVSV